MTVTHQRTVGQMTEAALDIQGLSHWYGDKVHALDDISLQLRAHEFLCVVGPSGCGKSTLLSLVAGFDVPTSGSLRCFGERVSAPSSRRGVVFQQPNLFPWLSVYQNVAFGLRLRHMKRSEIADRVHRLLDLVDLRDFADSPPYELSGGMQQRAAIARVLANEPDILLMDEPFGALDAITRERMQLALLNIWKRDRRTIVFITHDVEEAVLLGTRVIVMSSRPGRFVADLHIPIELKALGREMLVAPEFRTLCDEIRHSIAN